MAKDKSCRIHCSQKKERVVKLVLHGDNESSHPVPWLRSWITAAIVYREARRVELWYWEEYFGTESSIMALLAWSERLGFNSHTKNQPWDVWTQWFASLFALWTLYLFGIVYSVLFIWHCIREFDFKYTSIKSRYAAADTHGAHPKPFGGDTLTTRLPVSLVSL